MAENKKSFVAYCDWQETFEELSDEEAGKLVKHLFNYVNDKNPETSDKLTKMCFIPIKQSLKRDLKKYEVYIEKQSVNGKKGGRPKNPTLSETTQPFLEKPKKADSVSVSVSVNDSVSDSVNDISKEKVLLSKIKISDVPLKELDYYNAAIAFQKIFHENIKSVGGNLRHVESAEYIKWVSPIRLMVESDKVDKDGLVKVYEFLKTNDFWKSNIQSTKKLREKYNTLILQANETRKSGSKMPDEYLREVFS
jgi:hypothetical protein